MARTWMACEKCEKMTGNQDGVCESCKRKVCPKCKGEMRNMGRYLPEYRCHNPKCEDWYARPRHEKVR